MVSLIIFIKINFDREQYLKGGVRMDPCGHCFEECGLGVWHYPCPCIEAGASQCKE